MSETKKNVKTENVKENETVESAEATTVITMDDNSNFIVDLTSRNKQYCSMPADTPEEKAILFNCTNNTEFRISDCINKVISLKDVFVEVVNCTNKETGEIQTCPRVVLIDDKGKGYQSVSIGIYSAIKKLFAIYGEPQNWNKPIKTEVKQITKGERKMLTLNIVS